MKQLTGLGVLIATAVTLMAFSSVAGAHRHHSHAKIVVDSKISIRFHGGGDDQYAEQPNFSGRVRAEARRHGHHGHGHHHRSRGGTGHLEALCVKHRKVEIFRRNGPRIARTRTDRRGDYGVLAGRDFVAGKKYLATVETSTVRKGRTKVVCKGAASAVITAG